MLYHARQLTESVGYPWEKRKVRVVATIQRPSQVQRDYNRLIRGIGTPAPIPKPRGKSPGRLLGDKGGERPDSPLVRKATQEKAIESSDHDPSKRKKNSSKTRRPQVRYPRMQRIWSKNRSPPTRC